MMSLSDVCDLRLKIKGMDCPACSSKIERGVLSLDGVESARVDFVKGSLEAKIDEAKIDMGKIAFQIQKLGYDVIKEGDFSQSGSTTTSVFKVEDMDCADEAFLIERKLKSLEGVEESSFNFVARTMTVKHKIEDEDIERALAEIGFQATVQSDKEDEGAFWEKHKKTVLTIGSGIFTLLGFALWYSGFEENIVLPIYVLAMTLGGLQIAKKGLAAVRNLSLDMNFLMTIAVIGAAALGEWLEGAMIIFLFSLAQLLESLSMDKARNAIGSLMDLSPAEATVKRNGEQMKLAVEDVQIEDVMVLKPGEKIALDGVVLSGTSAVNQAPMTGESIPVEKSKGHEVYAGTINEGGSLDVKVTKLSKDTTLKRIIHMVEEAQSRRAPSQNFVDKFTKYYTPTVIAGAVGVATVPWLFFEAPFGHWFYRALVLLVISCPCALVISTPVSIVSGIMSAAKRGVLIKGGLHLENTGTIRALAFDKTGTLTEGRPYVDEIISINSFSHEEIIEIAASVESRSEHHLAQAIVEKGKEIGIDIKEGEDLQIISGMGVQAEVKGWDKKGGFFIGNHRLVEEKGLCNPEIEAHLNRLESEGKTAVILGDEEGVIGIMSISDRVRKGIKEVIEELHKSGIQKIIMLTGDNKGTADAIAKELGIDEYKAELLPQDKVDAVEQLRVKYSNVAMVGDGVNDAPALAASTVGIAMGAIGTDTALETADIALMSDDLSKLPYTVELSRKTVTTIKENIFLSILIKALFLALAIGGMATLWMAVAADMGASLLVIFNGLKVLRFRAKQE